jgi:cytochrome P450
MLNRMVRKETTLSDGTVLPAGVDVAVNAMEVHISEKLWKNADTFNGFRFVELRENVGDDSKHQLVKSEYVLSITKGVEKYRPGYAVLMR